MSIGRIRTATTTTPQAPTGGAAPTGPGAPFEAGRTEAAAPVAPSSGPLADLRAGKIDRDGYIEAHVAQATAHLGALSPKEQETVREQLRERCEADPLLADLIAKATTPA